MAKLTLVLTLLMQKPEPAILTHYGTGDGFLGARHGASWHGNSCGLPPVVDLEHYGIAAPRWIPYCTEVLVCYQQRCVLAVVVDRMADNMKDGMPRFDLWPAAAKKLNILEVGIVRAQVRIP